MADTLSYRVSVAAPVDGDVVARQLTLIVNGDVQGTTTFSGDATDLGTVSAPQGSLVVLELVDVDDAGNLSAPAILEFTAVDTLAPAQPGGFSVVLTGETSTPTEDDTAMN